MSKKSYLFIDNYRLLSIEIGSIILNFFCYDEKSVIQLKDGKLRQNVQKTLYNLLRSIHKIQSTEKIKQFSDNLKWSVRQEQSHSLTKPLGPKQQGKGSI